MCGLRTSYNIGKIADDMYDGHSDAHFSPTAGTASSPLPWGPMRSFLHPDWT